VLEPVGAALPPVVAHMTDACGGCGSEFLIGAKFCHACGLQRTVAVVVSTEPIDAVSSSWARGMAWVRETGSLVADAWDRVPFPSWLRYLHFHEIQRWVGLPTASLLAFIVGLGCVTGAIGVSLFYKASNLGEFQAIQLWRIEWLLGATASFVAGILLKKPGE
jgi:hypothetical protein